MRKLICLIFFLQTITLCYSQQSYFPLVESNKLWYEIWTGHPSSQSNVFKCEGDTIINSTLYNFVYISFIDYPFNWFKWGYIREDENHKVYFSRIYPNNPTSFDERLLYDFNAKVDDELTIHAFGFESNPTSFQITITSIDSVLVDGIYRKRTKFNRGFYQLSYWIEGLGCVSGLLNPGGEFIWACPAPWLSCVKLDGEIIFPDGFNGSCWVVGVPEEKEYLQYFQIYPNPAKEIIVVSPVNNTGDNHNLILYSQEGRFVDEFKLYPYQSTTIILPNLTYGLYLYRIKNDGSEVQAGKIMIL